jgi:hypothetical protein
VVEGYGEGSRAYRLNVKDRDDLAVRVFRERDIPIQIALGNYDLGICSLSWVKEMQALFPDQPLVPLCDLGIGATGIYAAGPVSGGGRLADIARLPVVRIASDYPNLAESFAMAARLPRYRVSLSGVPPKLTAGDADAVVIAAPNENAVRAWAPAATPFASEFCLAYCQRGEPAEERNGVRARGDNVRRTARCLPSSNIPCPCAGQRSPPRRDARAHEFAHGDSRWAPAAPRGRRPSRRRTLL